ncbi:MAG: carboxypeptidase regulatory-like domain-containing protein, partial [Bacteroidales bacterium]
MTTRNQFLFSLFYLSFFLFVFSSVPLRAQDNTNIHPNGNSHPTVINKLGKISGKVLDQSNGYIMEYVNIIVIDAKTKNMLGGTITNAKGEFTIEELPYGSFIVKISYIGFSEFQSAVFTLTPKNPIFKLSPVSLVPNATTLAAVEVVGQKRVMEYTLDKKVINVEQNLVSDGGTAVDILQNVPAVSVDADGNVSMKGSSNITILIDGRPAELSGMDWTNLQPVALKVLKLFQ